MKDIFKYTNYRTFLKDFYQGKKKSEGYTYRDFSEKAGVNSSSWLLHLINGKKNLSNESIMKVVNAIELDGYQAEYFELMVHFTQARTGSVKDYFYKKMIDLKKRLKIRTIEEYHYEYYAKWYHPIIRSLVTKIDFKDDYSMLAKNVLPAISAGEARKSVSLLEKLGFIKQDASGNWKQIDKMISTGDEVTSLNVVNYHKQVNTIAADAMDRSGPEWRDVSALTLGINHKDFLQIKSRIQMFRKEILEMARKSKNEDCVYQLNLQLFPASKFKDLQ